MSNIYTLLAPFYDAMNGDVDYEGWADFYERELRRYEKEKTSLVLDLGCGTGSMTKALAHRGYDMTGVDYSPEMLDIARQRAEKEGLDNILWLCQDMTEFELYGTVEAVVSSLDCINHITEKASLSQCFSLVHNYLSPGGLFLFDVNSPYKFETVYGDRAYLLEDENAFCAWQNCYRKRSGLCDFYITLFEKQSDGSYLRREEFQREKMYTEKTLRKLLSATGFEVLSVSGGLDGHVPTATDERLYFTARCIK